MECVMKLPGCTGVGIWQEDPYAAEISGNHTEMWLCKNCAAELAADI